MMATHIRRGRPAPRRPSSRGQALVEFTLILPVFLLMTIGVVDMAHVFSSYIALTDGVREAALFAANGSNNEKWCAFPPDDRIACPPGATGHQAADPDNIAYQIEFDGAALDPTRIVMQAPVCDPDPCTVDGTVKVGVTYTAPLLTPILSNVLGGTITMSVSTTAKVLP
jgi:Flp pilus assembly protein TadG